MLLSELEQGAKVLLLLTIDGKHFEFETIVQGKHKHDVLLEPIRKDQKILNVQSDQVDVDIMYMREDDKPILWKEAKMGCIRHKHKIYYASEAANEGREYNRRGAYRLYIGEEIHARIGHSGREKIAQRFKQHRICLYLQGRIKGRRWCIRLYDIHGAVRKKSYGNCLVWKNRKDDAA